jgi:hypothetical protein
MSVDCIVADDNPLLDFISIKNLNFFFNLSLAEKICFCSPCFWGKNLVKKLNV